MTNILLAASLITTLTTNVVERFPMHSEPYSDPSDTHDGCVNAVYRCHWIPDANPKEKWISAHVVQQKLLVFQYEGKWITNELSHVETAGPETHMELEVKTAWKPSGSQTMTIQRLVPSPSSLLYPNLINAIPR